MDRILAIITVGGVTILLFTIFLLRVDQLGFGGIIILFLLIGTGMLTLLVSFGYTSIRAWDAAVRKFNRWFERNTLLPIDPYKPLNRALLKQSRRRWPNRAALRNIFVFLTIAAVFIAIRLLLGRIRPTL
jgi:hypothetical protein